MKCWNELSARAKAVVVIITSVLVGWLSYYLTAIHLSTLDTETTIHIMRMEAEEESIWASATEKEPHMETFLTPLDLDRYQDGIMVDLQMFLDEKCELLRTEIMLPHHQVVKWCGEWMYRTKHPIKDAYQCFVYYRNPDARISAVWALLRDKDRTLVHTSPPTWDEICRHDQAVMSGKASPFIPEFSLSRWCEPWGYDG